MQKLKSQRKWLFALVQTIRNCLKLVISGGKHTNKTHNDTTIHSRATWLPFSIFYFHIPSRLRNYNECIFCSLLWHSRSPSSLAPSVHELLSRRWCKLVRTILFREKYIFLCSSLFAPSNSTSGIGKAFIFICINLILFLLDPLFPSFFRSHRVYLVDSIRTLFPCCWARVCFWQI